MSCKTLGAELQNTSDTQQKEKKWWLRNSGVESFWGPVRDPEANPPDSQSGKPFLFNFQFEFNEILKPK